MQLLMTLLLIIIMYAVGYITGYRESEETARQMLNTMIKEHAEFEEYKISKYEEK